MKKRLFGLFGLSLLCLALAALPKVAVLDISAQKDIDASVVVPITETIMEEVVSARAYVVLDRAYVEQVMKELEFELSGLVGDTQAAKAGQFLGADYVVAGKVQHIGDAFFLVAKMIEVRTGVIVAQASEQGEGKLSVLLGLSRAVGKRLVATAPITALAPSPASGSAGPSAGGAASPSGGSPGVAAGGAGAAPTQAAPPQATASAVTGAAQGAAIAPEAPRPAGPARIKAGFVMPFSVKDMSISDVMGIAALKSRHSSWLDLVIVDELRPENLAAALDRLAEKDRCDIIFSCDWGYVEEFQKAATRHPAVKFQSAGGELNASSPSNFSVYGNNEWNHLYLQGLVAGSMSAKGRIGLMAESLEQFPWWRKHINRFVLGVRAANPKAQVYVVTMSEGHWGDAKEETAALRALLDKGCDFFSGHLSNHVVSYLNGLALAGTRALCFIRDFSYTIAPAAALSGPQWDYAYLYEQPLLKLRSGSWKAEAWYPHRSTRFGGSGEAFNPRFLPELEEKKVKTPDRGVLPLLSLLEMRGAEMEAESFEPFTGPVKDQKGLLRIPAGLRPDWRVIETMDWFVEGVVMLPKP